MKRWILAIVACLLGFVPSVSASATTVHVVTFFSNGNSGPNETASESGTTSKALTSFNSLVPTFTNSGYVFLNWNTAQNGSGTTYVNGQTFSFASNLVLYAQWTPVFHNVGFLENRSTADKVFASETKNASTPLTLFSNLSPAFSNPGYAFAAWNTKANGSGTTYLDGASYSFKSDLVLYAQWVKVIAASAPLVLVGVVRHSRDQTTIQRLATTINSRHFHRIEVVQVGAAKSGPASATKVASSLTQLLLQRGGPEVTVVIRRVGNIGSLNFAEVFAS